MTTQFDSGTRNYSDGNTEQSEDVGGGWSRTWNSNGNTGWEYDSGGGWIHHTDDNGSDRWGHDDGNGNIAWDNGTTSNDN